MAYEYEYDDAGEDYGGRVLWGRLAVFGVALVLVFVLGQCTAGDGADPQALADLTAERDSLLVEREELTAAVNELQERIRDLTQTGASPAPGATSSPGTGTGTEATAPPGGPQPDSTYIVQSGDTLASIAEAVYGDPGAFSVIAEANGISEDSPLQIGQELRIPPNPDTGNDTTATESTEG